MRLFCVYMYMYHKTCTVYTCTLYINYVNERHLPCNTKSNRTFSHVDIHSSPFVNYTCTGQDVCWLVVLVHIVAQELVFVPLSGGFTKALVHVLVDADEFHC